MREPQEHLNGRDDVTTLVPGQASRPDASESFQVPLRHPKRQASGPDASTELHCVNIAGHRLEACPSQGAAQTRSAFPCYATGEMVTSHCGGPRPGAGAGWRSSVLAVLCGTSQGPWNRCRRSVYESGANLALPRCRATFPSSMQVDPELFAWISLNQQLERCTACGNVGRYERRD